MSDDDSDELYSIKSSQTVYKRTRSRPSSVGSLPRIHITSDSDEGLYSPVQKWAVDYNNKNYVRSMCNKNIGQHRKIRGRPLDWNIEYDGSYFTRSKVDPPKGLHRKIPEVKRKYVPDKDDLADATGWEFDWGPEIDQIEQDVTYIPEGRIVHRGCYRWYGVKRNDSDCDIEQKEKRENLLTKSLKKELKCGQEFLQSDIPHLSEDKNLLEKRYTRGAYRHYEVQRNAYDIRQEDLESASQDPEWKRKHHANGFRYLDLDMCDYDRDGLSEHYSTVKGKPFKRTILNKVYELKKAHDPRDYAVPRRRTQLSLVPGEGDRTEYHGVPDRFPFKSKQTPSIRSIFKKKAERQRYRSSREGDEFEEYEREDREESYREELEPDYEEKIHRMADRKRGQRRRSSYEDARYHDDRDDEHERFREYTYRVKSEDRHIQRRHSMDTPRRSGRTDKFETPSEDRHTPRRHTVAPSRRSGNTDEFETWSENAVNTKRGAIQRVKERKGSYRDDDYYPKDIVVETRRNTANELDYSDLHSQSSSRSMTDHDYDHHSHRSKGSRKSMRHHEVNFEDISSERNEPTKKLPPHVAERMKKIRQKMHEKFKDVDYKYRDQGDNEVFDTDESEVDIALMKHRGHPNDRGQEHNSEYEKYVTKNGSELWIKKEEKYTELHHKDH